MLPDAAHIQEKDDEFLQRRGKAGAGERAAVQPGRRGRGAGADGGRAVPPDHPPAEASRARVRRGRAHPGLGDGRPAAHRGRQPPASSSRATSAGAGCRSSATPSRPPGRSTRSSSSRPTPTGTTSSVAGRRGAAGRGGAADGRAGREDPDPGVRARAGAGDGLQPAPAPPRAAGSRRSRSTSTARSPSTRRRSSGCIPRSSTRASSSSSETSELFDFPLVRYVRDVADVQGAQPGERAADDHRGERHGGVGPDPAPPGARHRRPPEPGPLRRLPGGAHARPPDPERRGDRAHPRRGSSRAAPRSRRIGGYSAHADRTSSGPGCAGWAGRSGAPSWCTARRRRSRPWPRSSRRKACAR